MKDILLTESSRDSLRLKDEVANFLWHAGTNEKVRNQLPLICNDTSVLGVIRKHYLTMDGLHVDPALINQRSCSSLLAELIRIDKMPVSLWLDVMESNIMRMHELNKTFQGETMPPLMQNFKNKIGSVIAKYNVAYSERDINTRLDGLRIQLYDGLSMASSKMTGGYRPLSNGVIFTERLLEERPHVFERVFNHEMLHVLSGRLVVDGDVSMPFVDGERLTMEGSDELRIGLAFNANPVSGFEMKERFLWLNEGVTQLLTLEMLTEKEANENMIYVNEIRLVQHLLSGGKTPVDFCLPVRAYFENYEPKKENDTTTIPHWRSFMKAINDSFEPGYLVALDKKIKSGGIENVIKELELQK